MLINRHISVGTFAIISLMTSSSVKKYDGVLYNLKNATDVNKTYSEIGKVEIAMALGFGVGIVHILFSILHIGVVTKYLSDAIVNGFTCGAAYQTVTSQIPTLLGISLGEIKIPFVIVGVSNLKKKFYSAGSEFCTVPYHTILICTAAFFNF